MPPTRSPAKSSARGSAASARAESRSRLSRAFGRFGAAQRGVGKGQKESVATFFRDIRLELRKVEWPTREELVKLTAAVVGLSAVVGIFLGGVDFIFQELFKVIIGLSGGGV